MSESIAKGLMVLGAVVFAAGALVYFSDRLPFLKSIGRLPGDFSWRGENWQVHFPFATSIVFSVVLTLLFWLVNWLSARGGR